MQINDLTKLTFTVEYDGDFIRLEIKEPLTDTVVGELRIKNTKGIAYLNALQTIFREVRGPYAEFDENITARAYLDNNNNGTIEFNE